MDLTVNQDARPRRLALVQAIQHHPLSQRVLHVDFHEVAENEKVTISVLGTQANDYSATPLRGAGQRCPVIRGWEGSLSIDRNNKEIVFTGVREGRGKADQRFPIERGRSLSNAASGNHAH